MGIYKRAIFFILFIFCTTVLAIANIPIGSLVTYNKPFVSNDKIIITNKSEQQLPSISGLQLFAGDKIETNTEEIFILIPSTGLIVKVHSFSQLDFNVLDLGGRRYVIQVIANTGSLELLLHQGNDILQLVQGVTPPKKVNRIDRLVDTSSSSMLQYTQIINNGADIISTNIDYDSRVFITQSDFDIKHFIEAFNSSDDKDKSLLLEKLAPPKEKVKVHAIHQFTFDLYLKQFTEAQYITGFYSMRLEKGKFFTTLQFPIFFPRNGSIYMPVGENDWYFGLEALDRADLSSSRKALVIASHSTLDTLNKLKDLSYGTPNDFFYFYYGPQQEWHNSRTTLFAYHYNPIKTFENNFNKDVLMLFNGKRIGYEFRVRQFQPIAFNTLLYESLNLVYNRFWIKPGVPLNTFEIGVFAAGDFSVGALNANDKTLADIQTTMQSLDPNVDARYGDPSTYIMGLAGLDITIPIINYRNYLLESNSELGVYLPFKSSSGYLRTNKLTYVNFVAKSGFNNTFFSRKNANTKQGVYANFYYASGLAKPHYAMSGYEYTYNFYRTRSISMIELDRLTAITEISIFKQYSLIPEVDYFVSSDFLQIALGTYIPINTSSNIFLGAGMDKLKSAKSCLLNPII